MAEQRRSGDFNNVFKFNGKELDTETGLYYYGARYYNPRTSVWLSVDPIALWNPVQETEHYILGQHNGGYFNPKNMSVYGYTYQNPIRYIDPNGKQVDINVIDQSESTFHKGGQKINKMSNAFQVMGHGAPGSMLDQRNGIKEIDGPMSFNESFEDNIEWQAGKN